MATLQTIKKRVLELRGKELSFAKASINENIEIAADLNREQLAQGLLKDGTFSDYPYSPLTIAIKKGRSGIAGITDHLTNYDTGESYQKLYAKVEGDKIIFGTTSDKESAISDRMEGKAFGLAPEEKTDFIREYIKPNFRLKINSILKL